MPASGRILRGSLCQRVWCIRVRIVLNGRRTGVLISKPAGLYSSTNTYSDPRDLAQNDRINFQTVDNTSNATNNICLLLIELDL